MEDRHRYISNLAKKLLGIPYIWGGSSPQVGFDCSGFVIWILQVMDMLPSGDWTADDLRRHFTASALPNAEPGDLVFYGPNADHATHVMMYLGLIEGVPHVIGASGGDHTTVNVYEAKKRGAMVKIKPIDYRKDRIALGAIDTIRND